jgi:type II secretory ATPase GspE/PulE/Tfp pilus assembly ATPase PilB-like protein
MTPDANGFPPLTLGDGTPEETIDLLIERAAELRAGELFLASQPDHVAVRVRHLGLDRPLGRLPLDLGRRCLGFIKAAAEMDVAEHRRPLDGRWSRQLPSRGRIDLRIATLPTLHGEDCSLRLQARDPRPLAEIGVIRRELTDLLAMLSCPSGLLLITGPNGSGKTTTVYTLLGHLHNGERRINTIEDPIEYEIPGLRQSQVNLRIGLGYPELLRGVLRQAPDVILIGEIGDAVTAATAVHAANSGHLVLATLHAPTAVAAVQSLRAWGVHPHFLAGALLGVAAQRLVRILCPACRQALPPEHTAHLIEEVRPWLEPGQEPVLYAARGCSDCHHTGYVGRAGIFEVLRVSAAVRCLIAEGRGAEELRAQAVREGLTELRQAAWLKVAQGQTTAAEVARTVSGDALGLVQ